MPPSDPAVERRSTTAARAITEVREYPGYAAPAARPRTGWEQIADDVLDWALAARPPRAASARRAVTCRRRPPHPRRRAHRPHRGRPAGGCSPTRRSTRPAARYAFGWGTAVAQAHRARGRRGRRSARSTPCCSPTTTTATTSTTPAGRCSPSVGTVVTTRRRRRAGWGPAAVGPARPGPTTELERAGPARRSRSPRPRARHGPPLSRPVVGRRRRLRGALARRRTTGCCGSPATPSCSAACGEVARPAAGRHGAAAPGRRPVPPSPGRCGYSMTGREAVRLCRLLGPRVVGARPLRGLEPLPAGAGRRRAGTRRSAGGHPPAVPLAGRGRAHGPAALSRGASRLPLHPHRQSTAVRARSSRSAWNTRRRSRSWSRSAGSTKRRLISHSGRGPGAPGRPRAR